MYSRRSVLGVHWRDCCWNWNSNTLATWCEDLTHWKRPWCWERLKAGGGDDRGRDSWMASPTQWTQVWASSGIGGLESLACCSPWGCKESNMTERLNWTVFPLSFLFSSSQCPHSRQNKLLKKWIISCHYCLKACTFNVYVIQNC